MHIVKNFDIVHEFEPKKKDPMSQFEEIEVRQDGVYANTKAGDPLVPIDDILHPNRNRHERRKVEALARRNRRKGR